MGRLQMDYLVQIARQRGVKRFYAKVLPMNKRSAPDGTCWLLVPQGWNFTAGKGAALCASLISALFR